MTIVSEINLNTLKSIKQFAENYAKLTNTVFHQDINVTNSVLHGLTIHKQELGAPLCPCRFYENKEEEVNLAYWNCPCIPMRERKECHCLLFLKPTNSLSI